MKRDLVVLVPDADIEAGLRALLRRHESIGIREIRDPQFLRHPHQDPGLYHRPERLLQPVRHEFSFALVVLDEAWSGSPGAAEIEREVEQRAQPAFAGNVRCVCIRPEVEQWIWSDSPHVATALGWESYAALRDWLVRRGAWGPREAHKPVDPKLALELALREKRIPRSSALYKRLASEVGLARCEDPSYARLLTILRTWFAPGPAQIGD